MKATIRDTITLKEREIRGIHTMDAHDGNITFFNRQHNEIETVVIDHTKLVMVEK